MAKTWSFEEDYIVGKFCSKIEKWYVLEQEIDRLMDLLANAGFTSRSKQAVSMRVRQYQSLRWDNVQSYAPQQVKDVFDAFSRDSQEMRLAIKSDVEQSYNPEEIVVETIEEANSLQELSKLSNGLVQFIATIDFNQTFPMVLQKYLDLKGLKNRDVYRRIYMKADTFSTILRGKYDTVKKENVMRLCVGLQLTVMEAEELMASAGYLFSEAIKTDVIVKACLEHRIYSPTCIDIELYENKVPVLFAA